MDQTYRRSERKSMRYGVLKKLFLERRCHTPKEPYDVYILDLITQLGEIYDDNSDEIRSLLRTDNPAKKKRLDELRDREKALHDISHNLRLAVGVSTANAGQGNNGERYERRPGPQQSRVKQSTYKGPLDGPSGPCESSDTLHE